MLFRNATRFPSTLALMLDREVSAQLLRYRGMRENCPLRLSVLTSHKLLTVRFGRGPAVRPDSSARAYTSRPSGRRAPPVSLSSDSERIILVSPSLRSRDSALTSDLTTPFLSGTR